MPFRAIYELDLASGEWSNIGSMPDARTQLACGAILDTELLIAGKFLAKQKELKDVIDA